jgi:hypothetical protein
VVLFRVMVRRVVIHGHVAKMHPVRHQHYLSQYAALLHPYVAF